MLSASVHEDVARSGASTSGICRCGAVYDNGNVSVPIEYRGLCGRCAMQRGMKLATLQPAER